MGEKQQKPLCPFKKIVEREHNGHKGITTMRERFDVCAGARCMAYKEPVYGVSVCKRLEPDR